MIGIPGLDKKQFQEWLAQKGFPRFRVDQVLGWVYRRGVHSWDQMTNVGVS